MKKNIMAIMFFATKRSNMAKFDLLTKKLMRKEPNVNAAEYFIASFIEACSTNVNESIMPRNMLIKAR